MVNVAWIALLAPLVIGLILLGSIVGLVVLLVNRNTRLLGVGLLVMGPLLAVVGLGFLDVATERTSQVREEVRFRVLEDTRQVERMRHDLYPDYQVLGDPPRAGDMVTGGESAVHVEHHLADLPPHTPEIQEFAWERPQDATAVTRHRAVGLVALPAVALVGLFVGLGLLLASPKTRPVAGKAILVIPILMVFGFVFLHRSTQEPPRMTEPAGQFAMAPPRAEVPPPPVIPVDARTIDSFEEVSEELVGSTDDGSPKETDDESPAENGAADREPPHKPIAVTSAERPDWVGTSPRKVDGVYQMTVEIGPWDSRAVCDEQRPFQLKSAVAKYVRTYLGPSQEWRVGLPQSYIEGHVVKQEWEETADHSVGPMTTVHLLLEFDRETNARIQDAWHKILVNQRLGVVGVAGVAIFVLLSLVYGYLKIDLATKGAYRGRLRFGAALCILVIVGVLLMMSWVAVDMS